MHGFREMKYLSVRSMDITHACSWVLSNQFTGHLSKLAITTILKCIIRVQSYRAVWFHLKFAYHDTIVRALRYTLHINTSNVHMINDLHKTTRTPFNVCQDAILLEILCNRFDWNQSKKSSTVWLYCIIDTYDTKIWSQYHHVGIMIPGNIDSFAQHYKVTSHLLNKVSKLWPKGDHNRQVSLYIW